MNRLTIPGRRAMGLAVVVGVLGWVAAAAGQEVGWHTTPSGFQTRIPSVQLVTLPNGVETLRCGYLSAAEVQERAVDKSAAHKNWDKLDKVTVTGRPGGLTFTVVYSDPPGFGFNDPQLGATRRTAFETSLKAWSNLLRGTVPVVVQVNFTSSQSSAKQEEAGDEENQNTDATEGITLASAGPTDFYVINNVAYPYSLAAQLVNKSVNNGTSDIQAEFNPQVSWDYVLNGVSAKGTTSFVYTAIHEVGHGLGFLSTYDPATGALRNPNPTPYDTFLNRGSSGVNLLTSRSASQVQQDLLSSDLFFNGPNAIAASKASIQPLPMVKLYAPGTYESGSSISHVDQATYSDIRVGLMTPSDFGPGFDKVDILVEGIMADLGYGLVDRSVTTGLGANNLSGAVAAFGGPVGNSDGTATAPLRVLPGACGVGVAGLVGLAIGLWLLRARRHAA